MIRPTDSHQQQQQQDHALFQNDSSLESVNLETQQQQQQESIEESVAHDEADLAQHPCHDQDNNYNCNLPSTTPSSSSATTTATCASSSFSIGDHVYHWCSFAGIPAVYSHHGIVMDVQWVEEQNDYILSIADFSNWTDIDNENYNDTSSTITVSSGKIHKKSLFRRFHGSCIRTYESSAKSGSWRKVEYEANIWKRHFWRVGTCTAAASDAPGLVMARLQFLLDHPEVLPPYNMVQSNCECVAVWCKTGTWGTLQATSWLAVTAAGQAKSAVTLATAAATTQVTVPAAGLWGWLGYTTHVSLAATQPMLLPAIAVYGVVTAGAPTLWLFNAQRKWKDLTVKLNEAFWEAAVEHPDIFVECITHWSSLS